MEFLFFGLVIVVIIVRAVLNEAKKGRATTPPPRRARPARRGQYRPWEQTPSPPTQDAAPVVTDDRPETPTPWSGAVRDDEPEQNAPAPAPAPALEPLASVDQAPDPEPEPQQPTPVVPTSEVFSASAPVYTPTSIYSGYTPATLYESEPFVGSTQKPDVGDEGDDDSEDPSPQDPALRS